MNKDTKLKVAFVEDNEEVGAYLKDLLGTHPSFELIASYANANDAIKFIPKHSLDVVLLDIGLPDGNGIECVKQLKEVCPEIEFIMHTIFVADDKVFSALKEGASGYLLKNISSDKLIESIFEVAKGGSPMSPTIARKITNYFNKRTKNEKIATLLTKKEYEILTLLSKGLLYKEIASELSITLGTVKQYNHSIYQKLQVANKTEAINKYFGR